MKKAEIVIVHGVGAHSPNWSLALQKELLSQFSRIGGSCGFHEAIYTDVVESEVKRESDSPDPEDLQDEQAVQIDLARIDASIEAALGPEVVAEVEVQSILGSNVRDSL